MTKWRLLICPEIHAANVFCSLSLFSVLSLKIFSLLFINIHKCMYSIYMLFISEINKYFLTSNTFLFPKNECHSLRTNSNTV